MNRKTFIRSFALACLIIITYKFFDDFSGLMYAFGLIQGLFTPFIIAFVIAFLLNPIAMFFSNKVFNRFNKENKLRSYRLGVTLTYIIFFSLIILLIMWLTPLVKAGVSTLTEAKIEDYIHSANKIWDDLQMRYAFLQSIDFVDIMDSLTTYVINLFSSDNISSLINNFLGLTSTLFSWVMGIIISIYMLSDKDRLLNTVKKLVSLMLSDQKLDMSIQYIERINHIFVKFFFGKLLDSIIIGIIATTGFYFLNVPLYVLMGSVVLVTNMIPYFGPFIGAIPPVFLVLITTGDISAAAVIALFMLAVQQFDGIYLGPKILGDSVGVRPFWIITAIMLGGATFGFVGLLLCVPLAAITSMLFNDYYAYKKGLPIPTTQLTKKQS